MCPVGPCDMIEAHHRQTSDFRVFSPNLTLDSQTPTRNLTLINTSPALEELTEEQKKEQIIQRFTEKARWWVDRILTVAGIRHNPVPGAWGLRLNIAGLRYVEASRPLLFPACIWHSLFRHVRLRTGFS